MAFASATSNDPSAIGSGERFGALQVVLTATTFQNLLKVGRFAKLDTGSIDNFDGSVSPVPAGVVLRNVSQPIESGATIDNTLFSQVEYLRQGLATVEVKAGETPTLFGRVYISNAGDANDGMATATNTDEAVNAEFIREIQTGVWLVYINSAPGDIASHLADAVGAHAASAISLLDTAGLTTAIEVEAAIAEILLRTPAAIADPGDAGAIVVTRTGVCPLTIGSAGAETRTLAIPSFVGQRVSITADVVGTGTAAVTAASAINQAANTIMTFATAADHITLEASQVGGVLVWRVATNDGVALS